VIAAAQDASSADANTDTIMPRRIRVRSRWNSWAICCALSFGDGGGMKPAITQNPRKNSTRQTVPFHAHARCALAFIAAPLR
jgi:hypothetical protein